MDEVLSVLPNQYRTLHTTRSWDFIGLPLTAKRKLQSESDTIVALLDTGSSYLSSHFIFFFCFLHLLVLDVKYYINGTSLHHNSIEKHCFHIGEAGVTPEFQSFKDNGLGPPPAKWNGSCDHFANFSGCNK